MTELKIFMGEDDQPAESDVEAHTSHPVIVPDISVTELLMEIEASLIEADAEIQKEQAEQLDQAA